MASNGKAIKDSELSLLVSSNLASARHKYLIRYLIELERDYEHMRLLVIDLLANCDAPFEDMDFADWDGWRDAYNRLAEHMSSLKGDG